MSWFWHSNSTVVLTETDTLVENRLKTIKTMAKTLKKSIEESFRIINVRSSRRPSVLGENMTSLAKHLSDCSGMSVQDMKDKEKVSPLNVALENYVQVEVKLGEVLIANERETSLFLDDEMALVKLLSKDIPDIEQAKKERDQLHR